MYHGQNRIRNASVLAEFDLVVTTYSTLAADDGGAFRAHDPSSPIRQIRWYES
jgi:hypothetical protein